jgi:hypothetical protein
MSILPALLLENMPHGGMVPAFDFENVILAGKSSVQFWILFPWLTQSPS